MADYYINIFLGDDQRQKIEAAGLVGEIKEIDGRQAVQVGMTEKEQKKLLKSFPDLAFNADQACVLPESAEQVLMGFIENMKTLDVMKGAIMKLYNPLAGKALRAKVF